MQQLIDGSINGNANVLLRMWTWLMVFQKLSELSGLSNPSNHLDQMFSFPPCCNMHQRQVCRFCGWFLRLLYVDRAIQHRGGKPLSLSFPKLENQVIHFSKTYRSVFPLSTKTLERLIDVLIRSPLPPTSISTAQDYSRSSFLLKTLERLNQICATSDLNKHCWARLHKGQICWDSAAPRRLQYLSTLRGF